MDEQTRPLDAPINGSHVVVGQRLPGTALHVDAFLGEGGSSRVYRTTDEVTQRSLAVKVLRAGKSSVYEGFLRESRLLRQLRSPWVVGLEQEGILPDGRPWFAMELLAGRSLSHTLSSSHSTDLIGVVRWLRQACRGLGAIHDSGWAHRDVKPANFVWARGSGGGRLAVIDLGIAERFGVQPRMLSGTPEYMAPEQAQSKPIDLRSDIYALGCCAYEFVVGRRLVSSHGSLSTINLHIDGIEVAWPEDGRVPYILRRLIERCLAYAPEARPPSMYALERELGHMERELLRLGEPRRPTPSVTPCDVTTVVWAPVIAANDEPTASTPARACSGRTTRRAAPSRWRALFAMSPQPNP